MFKHILIPTDGSKPSERAVRAGIEFARETGARVTAYYALPRVAGQVYGEGYQFPAPDTNTEFVQRASSAHAKFIDRIGRLASDAGVAFDAVVGESSTPAKGIAATAAKRECDVIFIGTRALGALAKLVRGSSVTESVLRESKVPVLVYR
jgi:nucleotide-binding universal stress UspA family protein